MTREKIEFIIETLENAIEWGEHVTLYYQEKNNLAQDKKDVKQSIELLKNLNDDFEKQLKEMYIKGSDDCFKALKESGKLPFLEILQNRRGKE